MSEFSRLVSEWETFYLLTGTAAATLIGLLFVAISVGSETVEAKAKRDLALFGALTFNCFFYVMVISILFLIPGISRFWLGIPLAVLGLLALAGTTVQRRQSKTIPPDRFGRPVAGRFTAPILALLLIVVIGVMTAFGVGWSLYGLVVAIISLLASASQNAWALLMLDRP